MGTACLVATGLFSLFAYWQLNDLEQYGTQLWLGWFLLYGATAAVSLVSARRLLRWSSYAGGTVAVLAAAAIRVTAIEWDQPIFSNETNPAGNETGGLLIVAAWLALLAQRAWRATGEASPDDAGGPRSEPRAS